MARTTSSGEESPIFDLKLKAMDLRIAKIKSEKEFIGLRGTEIPPEQAAELENKRSEIFYQLELEGAEIERQYIELLRSRLVGFGFGDIGVFEAVDSCWVCQQCVTAKCLTCTACASCVLIT